jgi:acyl CoA:acetate/3-ketoacid CoA transferase beta subunit
LASCDLPLTGRSVISRVITDLAVLNVADAGFDLIELAPGVEFAEVVAKRMRRCSTGARGAGRPPSPVSAWQAR